MVKYLASSLAIATATVAGAVYFSEPAPTPPPERIETRQQIKPGLVMAESWDLPEMTGNDVWTPEAPYQARYDARPNPYYDDYQLRSRHRTYSDGVADGPTPAIHIAPMLPADGPKVAYLSWWAGDQGGVEFTPGAWKIRRGNDIVATGETTGGDYSRWAGAKIWRCDFSDLTDPGEYLIEIEGVGYSEPFEIATDAANRWAHTMIRGLMHMRDGNHGLTPEVTQWHRPPAHLDDAIDERTGERVDLVGGHMDAGDRGRYPWNAADMACSILITAELFPDQVLAMGESLGMPESGNDFPDFIDEAIYELEWINKALVNSFPLGRYLRPVNANGSSGYEMHQPLEGKPDRMFYTATQGPTRHDTLYCIGALAMAARCELIPDDLRNKYRETAVLAFAEYKSFEGWNDSASVRGYDVVTGAGPHTWSDEMVIAAANLYALTGEAKYSAWIEAEKPNDIESIRRWGWDNAGTPITLLMSIRALPDYAQAATDALIKIADDALDNEDPFGAPLMGNVFANVGWYFSGEQIAYPAMIGFALTGEERYRDAIVNTYTYLTGGNNLNKSFVSGLGRDPIRWPVFEIGQYQWTRYVESNGAEGWPEIPPGIWIADIQSGNLPWYYAQSNDATNKRLASWAIPARADRPRLECFRDAWNTDNEWTVNRGARIASAIMPLVSYALVPVSDETPVVDEPEAPEVVEINGAKITVERGGDGKIRVEVELTK